MFSVYCKALKAKWRRIKITELLRNAQNKRSFKKSEQGENSGIPKFIPVRSKYANTSNTGRLMSKLMNLELI